MRPVILALAGLALLVGGCGCNQSVPIDEVEEPVAYVGRPPSTLASLVAPLVPEPVSAWGDEELMLLDAATGQTWQLTSNGEDDFQPTWSPSGTHLMYLANVAPYFRTRKLTKLYVYDLKAGTSRRVDLSWALESGPAAPRESFGDLSNWLQCAAWSPVDSTKVAVGVQVGGPTLKSPMGSENRFVLLDMEEKTGRFLHSYESSCGGVSWSPSGRYISPSVFGGHDLIGVDSGGAKTLRGGEVIEGDTLKNHDITDWREGEALVRSYSLNVDMFSVSEYSLDEMKLSKKEGIFTDSNRVVAY